MIDHREEPIRETWYHGGAAETWELQKEDGTPVSVGARISNDRGTFTIQGGSPPLHSGSTGRIFVRFGSGWEQEFYPIVFGLIWRRIHV